MIMMNLSWQWDLRRYPDFPIVNMIGLLLTIRRHKLSVQIPTVPLISGSNLTFLDLISTGFVYFSVLLFDPKTYQPPARGRSFLLCQQCDSTDLRNHGQPLPGAPWRRLLPLHRLLRRERVRIIIKNGHVITTFAP